MLSDDEMALDDYPIQLLGFHLVLTVSLTPFPPTFPLSLSDLYPDQSDTPISPRVFGDCRPHIMSSVIDLESQQVAQAVPRAGAFFPLSHHRRSGNGSQGRGGRNRDARNG